jgi:hypothetical protein
MQMAETNARTPRDLASREKTARSVYVPPSSLPDPTPEAGYAFRWIAAYIMGQTAHTNVSGKFRMGWVPVKAKDHPELMVQGNADGNVEIGGLLLCKISAEKAESMQDYYNDQAQKQMESVDNNFMRNNDPRMPLFADRKSSVSRGGFGSGIK